MASGSPSGYDERAVRFVVATKLRARRRFGYRADTSGQVFEGYLLHPPTVGRGMVIFRGNSGRRMVTTPVRRVLCSEGDHLLYVETENSIYRLAFGDDQLAAAG